MALGDSFIQTVTASQNLIGAASQGVNVASNLASALSTGYNSNPSDVMGAIRSINLPEAGEAVGDIVSAVSSFGGDAAANDWRVRLSLANWTSFKSSPVLKPLKDAGGLIFPYTPSITIASTATYSAVPTVHTNYTFQAFKNSEPGQITITAPMNVEDATQGLYWIAAVHYLRSLTKMFAGNDPKAGNPPPVVFLNGYGNYVFKNIPVVVTSFNTTLDAQSDYIGVNVVGSAAGDIQGVSDSIGGLAGAIGGLGDPGGALSDIAGGISSIAGGVGQIAGLAGSLGLGGSTSGGVSHVPTKSSFNVTLQPIYSRNSAKNFSLDRFVGGGYLNNSFGYI
jgi:hypothetical protein